MSPFFEIGQVVTFLFFVFFLIIFPLIGLMEKLVYHLYINKTINEEKRLSSHVYINLPLTFINIIKQKINFIL